MAEPVLFGKALSEQIAGTETEPNELAIWWLGHDGLVLAHGANTVLVDPYLSDVLNERGVGPRLSPAPLSPSELVGIDLILITSGSADHLDPRSLPSILAASPQALVVLPVGLADVAIDELGLADERLVPIAAGQMFEHGPLTVHALGVGGIAEPTHLEYVVAAPEGAVYLAGACQPRAALAAPARAFAPDLAFVPIGGRSARAQSRGLAGTLTPAEAARLAQGVGAGTVVPLHWDMFEQTSTDPLAFAEFVTAHYPELKVQQLELAGRWLFSGAL